MECQLGPEPHEERNLLYQLQRKVKVFNTSNPLPNRGYNLVASASKYGIVFIGSPDGKLAVYYLSQLIDKESAPEHLPVQLQEKPTHIAVSCDQELLAVIGAQLLVIYKVADFQNSNVSPSVSVKCDVNQSTFVSDLKWNPCIPDIIAIAFYDGTLIVLQASNGQVKKAQSKARCLCWSPKGKQLVVGNSDGTLCQYKPDLSPMKMVPAPKLFEGAPVEALTIHWISTFQFAVVFRNASDNSRPAVTIVNTPKGGQPTCLNYEDICYSMGSARPWYYYLQGLAQWNMILCSSSNSMEIATLGSGDGASWLQWCQLDEVRPELPFTDKKQENYPVGISIDTAAIHQLPYGENETLPHMPLLLVVSQTGLLVIYNIVNLNREAPQICSPPQSLTLPAGALIRDAVESAPSQPEAPALAAALQAKPLQPMPTPQPTMAPVSQPTPPFGSSATFSVGAPQPQVYEPKPAEIKPIVEAPTPTPQVQKPSPIQQKDQTQELNAALKAEQEMANKQKANQELKNMLIREVNEFQMELYKFVTKTRQAQIQFYRDLQSINTNPELQNLDAESIKKDCNVEDLRNIIIAQKLDLVRACAVVAEARTHSDAKNLDQWTQADPLTTKRVASVKKLAYYVQSQLDQAHRALDYKWNEQADRDMMSSKPGNRMIRPILDDVYQPLVKQQEILSRQQALLKTMRSTLNECNITPMFKSTNILRSTPFKNNKDPLSKLTKNILNMSIEPQKNEDKYILTPQKLDALRDMLSNHKTVKIKPVNVEMRHHLTAMRMSYEKSLKEKVDEQMPVKIEPKQSPVQTGYKDYKTEPIKVVNQNFDKKEYQELLQKVLIKKSEDNIASVWVAGSEASVGSTVSPPNLVKAAIKTDKEQPPTPSFTPINVNPTPHVARTLFAEPEKQPTKPQAQTLPPKQPLAPPKPEPVNPRSVLKDLLQSKQVTVAPKSDDGNSFMGQKICSPTSFNFSSVIVATPTSFTKKPISELNNMFNQFNPQAIVSEKKSSETGEPDSSVPLKTSIKGKEEKPMSNLFTIRTSTPLQTNSQNVPDVLANNAKTVTIKRVEPKTEPQPEKAVDKSKENVPEKASENVILSIPKVNKEIKKENDPKPLSIQSTNKPLFGSNAQPVVTSASAFTSSAVGDGQKSLQVQSENITTTPKTTQKSEPAAPASSASIFATANATITVSKPKPTSASSAISPSTPATTSPSIPVIKITTTTAATSIFANASSTLASPTKTEPASIFATAVSSNTLQSPTKTESGSIFASPSSTPSSVFGTSTTSIFGTTTTTQSSIFGATSVGAAKTVASEINSTTTTASSIFGSTAKSVFGSALATTTTAAPVLASPVSTPSSVFGSDVSTPSSVFGAVTTTTQSAIDLTTATTKSIFSTPAATSSSIFGSTTSTTQPSVCSDVSTPSSVFGAVTTTTQSAIDLTTATTKSIFSTPAATSSSIFGSATSTTQPSVFGGTPSQSSVFGSPATTQASVFGAAQTTQASVFGSPQTTQTSVFGSPATQASVFGTPTQTNQTSVFGAPAQTSVFGSPAQTQASVFGTPTQSTQGSVFGTLTQTTQASVFGTPTPTTQASVFGSPSQGSVFGAPTTTASSLFGGGESLSFASVNISTTSAPTQGESIFGGSSSSTSVFGSSNTNVFGGKATFGQPNPTASAIFGGAASFGQTAAPATNIWGSNNNSGGGFGSTGFGQPATTQASSVFGTGSFSAPSTGQGFGSGDAKPFGSPTQQTGGFGSGFGAKAVFGQSTGFGSPTASSGFGAPAAFGGFSKSPSGFGSSATFGGGASFGGSAFGSTSPGSVFGGTAAAPGFGSPTQSNATFESLATQNTLTFGNLAQQTPQQAQPAPSFNTSPSFTGWRG